MSQVLIIAKMNPEHAEYVADIFARSDATAMPHDIGVTARSLYRFHDLYVHLINFRRPVSEAMAAAQQMPAFRTMSEELRPHIAPYHPDWKSPQDAMATRFYSWVDSDAPRSAPMR